MPRNTLGDLNNHLFEQLERLNDESLTDDGLEKEVKRTRAMTNVADTIIDNARLVLQAQVTFEEHLKPQAKKPRLLEVGHDK